MRRAHLLVERLPSSSELRDIARKWRTAIAPAHSPTGADCVPPADASSRRRGDPRVSPVCLQRSPAGSAATRQMLLAAGQRRRFQELLAGAREEACHALPFGLPLGHEILQAGQVVETRLPRGSAGQCATRHYGPGSESSFSAATRTAARARWRARTAWPSRAGKSAGTEREPARRPRQGLCFAASVRWREQATVRQRACWEAPAVTAFGTPPGSPPLPGEVTDPRARAGRPRAVAQTHTGFFPGRRLTAKSSRRQFGTQSRVATVLHRVPGLRGDDSPDPAGSTLGLPRRCP